MTTTYFAATNTNTVTRKLILAFMINSGSYAFLEHFLNYKFVTTLLLYSIVF